MSAITETFATFAEALSACRGGYDDPDIAAVIAGRTRALMPELPGTFVHPEFWAMALMAVGMVRRGADTVRVVDFGGGCGLHYLCVKALLPGVALRWIVVETAEMARLGAALHTTGEIGFAPSIDAAMERLGACDVVNASGAIQYLAAPEETLRRLLELGAACFVLARFPSFRGHRCVGVQRSMLSGNGFGPMPPDIPDREVGYPVTFLPADGVRAMLAETYGRIEEVPSISAYLLKDARIDCVSWLAHGRRV